MVQGISITESGKSNFTRITGRAPLCLAFVWPLWVTRKWIHPSSDRQRSRTTDRTCRMREGLGNGEYFTDLRAEQTKFEMNIAAGLVNSYNASRRGYGDRLTMTAIGFSFLVSNKRYWALYVLLYIRIYVSAEFYRCAEFTRIKCKVNTGAGRIYVISGTSYCSFYQLILVFSSVTL